MSWDFNTIRETLLSESRAIQDPAALEAFRIKYLGRKGLLAEIYASFPQLSREEKPLVGKEANALKGLVGRIVEEKRRAIEEAVLEKASGEGGDVTIPGVGARAGHRHVLTGIIDEICGIFQGMGFAVQEGPEVEREFNNFSALNIPVDHPSRDAFDTFYLDVRDPEARDRQLLLRSHTSPGQVRIMQQYAPPLAVVIPGKVYRPDAVDASHSFMFHQVEGLLVDADIKFSHLKGLLTVFCRRFFGDDIDMRFRPHFFPFTEPSAEIDIRWKSGKKEWLEIMGCGMVHPHVFEACGYPRGKYTGLAFGMGVERMAMLRYGIEDIRRFYDGDVRFLHQF